MLTHGVRDEAFLVPKLRGARVGNALQRRRGWRRPIGGQHRFVDYENAQRLAGQVLENVFGCRGPLQTNASSGRKQQQDTHVVLRGFEGTFERYEILRRETFERRLGGGRLTAAGAGKQIGGGIGQGFRKEHGYNNEECRQPKQNAAGGARAALALFRAPHLVETERDQQGRRGQQIRPRRGKKRRASGETRGRDKWHDRQAAAGGGKKAADGREAGQGRSGDSAA